MIMAAEKVRPTAQELQAKATENPWACRSCGCCDWRVVRSQFEEGVGRKRERICRHCGEPMATIEVPVKSSDS